MINNMINAERFKTLNIIDQKKRELKKINILLAILSKSLESLYIVRDTEKELREMNNKI